MKRKLLAVLLTLTILFSAGMITAYAGFGAGTTPGWSITARGLAGEIPPTSYIIPPNYYRVGITLRFQATIFNRVELPVTTPLGVLIFKVKDDPDLTNPGLNENQLYDMYHNGTQAFVALLWSSSNYTIQPQGVLSFEAPAFTFINPGYYRFIFVEQGDRNLLYEPQHYIAEGYIRVLPN